MTRPATALLLIGLTLAACGTPQDRCIQRATKDLRIVNGLIEETEANLARGYAYETFEITRTRWETCYSPARVRGPGGKPATAMVPRQCLEDYTDTVRRPVAIDLNVERRKLDSLRQKQRELNRQASAEIDACRRQYPQ